MKQPEKYAELAEETAGTSQKAIVYALLCIAAMIDRHRIGTMGRR